MLATQGSVTVTFEGFQLSQDEIQFRIGSMDNEKPAVHTAIYLTNLLKHKLLRKCVEELAKYCCCFT